MPRKLRIILTRELHEERSIDIGTAQHWITHNYHYPLAVTNLQDTAQGAQC